MTGAAHPITFTLLKEGLSWVVPSVIRPAVAALDIRAAARVLAHKLALGHGARGLVALPVALRLVADGLAVWFGGVAGCQADWLVADDLAGWAVLTCAAIRRADHLHKINTTPRNAMYIRHTSQVGCSHLTSHLVSLGAWHLVWQSGGTQIGAQIARGGKVRERGKE